MLGQQHIQAAQTGLCWQALRSGSIHTMARLRVLVEQAKPMVVYGILLALPANNASINFILGITQRAIRYPEEILSFIFDAEKWIFWRLSVWEIKPRCFSIFLGDDFIRIDYSFTEW